MMNTQLDILTAKKAELDSHRPLLPEQVANVGAWLDLEYTYTSNAIEGNTLNRAETALVMFLTLLMENYGILIVSRYAVILSNYILIIGI